MARQPTTRPNVGRRYIDRWGLSDIKVIEANVADSIAFASSSEHGAVVLKQGGPAWRYNAEIAALKYYDGRGAVIIFGDAVKDRAYLMQAALPGTRLSALYHEGRDDDATFIIADLIKTLIRDRPASFPPELPPVDDLLEFFDRFKNDRHVDATDDVKAMVKDGANAFRAMLAEPFEPVVLHGDLHHFNILRNGDDWLAIDPHGYIGPPIFEVGAMMKNPWPDILDDPDMTALMKRRITILADELGWSAANVTRSAFVYAVISMLWDFKFDDKPGSFVPVVRCLHRLAT
ncbi:MAG: aminoglycoside phosphotransferase family protein [Alphaproteobacteria bacterium]